VNLNKNMVGFFIHCYRLSYPRLSVLKLVFLLAAVEKLNDNYAQASSDQGSVLYRLTKLNTVAAPGVHASTNDEGVGPATRYVAR